MCVTDPGAKKQHRMEGLLARREFRVVDCRSDVVDPAEIIVVAETPEQAASLAIGEDLVRGGRKSRPVAASARVYFRTEGALTMVRLYARTEQLESSPATNSRWDS